MFMHYVVTGSLGHTSKPIAQGLLQAGHTVTVVTSNPENADAITALGATPAVGDVADVDFVKQAFTGADAAYLLVPTDWNTTNWRGFQNKIADNYVAALQANDIRFAVLLSSIGAHVGKGVGPVDGLHDAEQKLAQVPGLNNKFLRPSYFMYNLFGMIGMVKGMGMMGSNFGDDPLVLVHTDDIAEVALKELLNLNFTGQQVRYIAGDERTGPEIAAVLGNAIGRPDLKWVVFTDEQNRQGMLQAGMNEEMANGYTDLGTAVRNGSSQADFYANRPAQYGKIKLEDFATNEFAPAYNA